HYRCWYCGHRRLLSGSFGLRVLTGQYKIQPSGGPDRERNDKHHRCWNCSTILWSKSVLLAQSILPRVYFWSEFSNEEPFASRDATLLFRAALLKISEFSYSTFCLAEESRLLRPAVAGLVLDVRQGYES